MSSNTYKTTIADYPATNFNGIIIQDVTNKGRGVFARRDFKQDELLIIGRCMEIIKTRSMTSLQMGWDDHAELDEPACVANHSCDPNLGVKNNEYGGYSFYALKNITKGDEVTWDYNTTEYISISVPECHCGAINCRKKTPGFKFLEVELKKRYGDYIGDYLKGEKNA